MIKYSWDSVPEDIRKKFAEIVELENKAAQIEFDLEDLGWTEEYCCSDGCDECEGRGSVYRYAGDDRPCQCPASKSGEDPHTYKEHMKIYSEEGM